VSGTLFGDADGDGIFSPSERSLLDGVTVYADLYGEGDLDANEPTSVTSFPGTYSLVLPANGTYTIRAVAPPGYTQTTADPGPVTLADGGFSQINFGFKLTAGGYVSGTLFYDTDGDKVRDAGEPGVTPQLATVYLDLDGNGQPGTGEPQVAVDSTGAFLIASPGVNGTYNLRVAFFGMGAAAATTTLPVSVSLTGGATVSVTAIGVRNTTGGLVTGTVFADADGDGSQDADEGPPAAGSLYVYDDANGDGILTPFSSTEPSTQVAPDGTFALFVGTDGPHQLRVSAPPFGSSLAVVPTLTPAPVSVSGGAVVGGLVLGGRFLTAIDGSVFNDLDADGTQARNPITFVALDPTLAGVRVYADLDGAGTFDQGEPTATTDANGAYRIVVPGAGTYTVRAVTAAGQVTTTDPTVVEAEAGFVAFAGAIGLAGTAGTISGTVFDDADQSTSRGGGEGGLGGYVVFADANGNNTRDAGEVFATSTADGSYTLTLFAPGTYAPRVELKPGTTRTTANPADVAVGGGSTTAGVDFGVFAPPVRVSIGNASVAEGDGGTVELVFTVTRSGDTTAAVTLNYATADGTGVAGTDYTAKSGTVSFGSGETTAEIRVPVISNARFQANRTLTVTLSPGTGAVTIDTATGTGTITDDDAPATVAAVAGTTPQSATVGTAFANLLAVDVRNAAGTLVEGVTVTFTAPGAGASGTFDSVTAVATTGANGRATATAFTANATAGPYTMTAAATGGASPSATFALTNTAAQQNTVPTISDIQNPPAVAPGALPGVITFTVGDAETPAANLTVTVTSSPPGRFTVVPGGTGATRTLTFTATSAPAGSTAAVTVAVSDGFLTAVDTFDVTVTTPTPNTAPTISDVGNQAIASGGSTGALAVTVGDAEAAAGSLTVTAASSNQTLVPNGNILVIGSGANRTVIVAAAAGQSGTATITLTVSDGALTATDTFTVTVTPPASPDSPVVGNPVFAVGSDVGGGSITVYNPDGTVKRVVTPFAGFTGGVRTATADFSGDGVPDVVAGSGPGMSAQVKVIDSATGETLFAANVFEGFAGGVFVAAGDLDGDGRPELVLTPDQGGGPRVIVIGGADFTQLASFFGITDPDFRGGARGAVGDINHDGVPDLAVAAGFGGGPRVAAFDGRAFAAGQLVKLFNDFFVFADVLRNGVYLAVGDIDGDGFGDLIAGAGPGGGPRILAFSGQDLLTGRADQSRVLANFFGGDTENRAGVRIAVKNLDGDARADLVIAPGTGAGGRVTAYLGKDIQPSGTPPEFQGLDSVPGFNGGFFVG
jgi:hypothetical protein